MAVETEIVNDVPSSARSLNGDPTVSLRPVRFSLASMWENPCTWILVGVVGTLVALHFLKKKG